MNRTLFVVVAIWLVVARAICCAEESNLSLSIAIPHTDDRPGTLSWVRGTEGGWHFHVILRNTSAMPINILQDEVPSGDFRISFEITDENGNTTVAHERPHIRFTHGPTYRTLAPQESAVTDIYFADHAVWGESFWPTPGHPTGRVTLRAVYQVSSGTSIERINPRTGKTGKSDIWIGKIVSLPVECFIK